MADRLTRHNRIRAKVSGVANIPRISLFKSNKNIFLQAIDDFNKTTIASSSTLKSKDIAQVLAKKLIEKKITKVVFDRSGYRYHGNVKKIAEELRKAGLKF